MNYKLYRRVQPIPSNNIDIQTRSPICELPFSGLFSLLSPFLLVAVGAHVVFLVVGVFFTDFAGDHVGVVGVGAFEAGRILGFVIVFLAFLARA